MKSDVNGCSTCAKGQENYEFFKAYGLKVLQYDYRTESGELFSYVGQTLEKCRAARDEWLNNIKHQ